MQSQVDFWVRGQPGLQSEFPDSQGYTEKPCLNKKTKKKKTKTKNKTKTKTKTKQKQESPTFDLPMKTQEPGVWVKAC